MPRQAVALALVAATAVAWQPATRISSRATPLKMSEQVTDEEEAEIIANAQKIAKKKRSNLYNEEGVAYAPWMVRQVDEDAVAAARAMRGYEKRRMNQIVAVLSHRCIRPSTPSTRRRRDGVAMWRSGTCTPRCGPHGLAHPTHRFFAHTGALDGQAGRRGRRRRGARDARL